MDGSLGNDPFLVGRLMKEAADAGRDRRPPAGAGLMPVLDR